MSDTGSPEPLVCNYSFEYFPG